MVRKFAQLQEQFLAGSGAKIGDDTIVLKSFKRIDGTDITDMTIFGDFAYATIEPGKSVREEQITFTGISVNGDGTVSLTGVSSVLMVDPYTETPGLTKSHAGGSKFVISNTSGFYKDTMTPDGNYEISGEFNYSNLPTFTGDSDLDETLDEPTEAGHFIHKEYLDKVIGETEDLANEKVPTEGDHTINGVKTFSQPVKVPDAVDPEDAVNKRELEQVTIDGAGLASETQVGLVSFATDEEFNNSTDTDIDGRPLVAKPSQVQASGINWNLAKSYAKNDIVNYEGKVFRSLIPSNLGNVPNESDINTDLASYTSNSTILTEAQAGGGDILSLAFSDDGLKAFTLTTSRILRRFTLDTPYQLNTSLVHDQTVTLTDDTGMEGIAFNSTGMKMYAIGNTTDKIYQYNLSMAFDISSITTADDEVALPTSEGTPFDIFITPDDMAMFYVGNSADEIIKLDFGTAGEVSTLSFGGKRLLTSGQEATETGIAMSDDGTKMLLIGTSGDNVYSYTLSTPFDISTATYDNIAFDISLQELNAYGIDLSKDGTKFYIIGNNDRVFQYNMTVANDLTTASYSSIELLVSAQDATPQDITFSDDGLRMFMIGTSSDIIYQYNLSTAWALNTASYSGNSFSYTTEETVAYGIDVAKDGLSIFIIGNLETVFKYTMSVANDISTASFDSSYLVPTNMNAIRGLIIENNGSTGYILDQTRNYVYQLDFGTAYDVSTITTDWRSIIFDLNPVAIEFSSTGMQMYLSTATEGFKYELASPYDIESAYRNYYIRPTTADAWSSTETAPSLSFDLTPSPEQEIGYIINSKFINSNITGFKFTATRGSGSSGGTNFAELTGRIYSLNPDGTPVSVATVEKVENLGSTWLLSPAVDFEVTFDTPVSVTTAQDLMLSIQYNSTDADIVTISNVTATLVTEGGIEFDLKPLVNRDSILKIIGFDPTREFIYTSNTGAMQQYQGEKIESIFWGPQSSFGLPQDLPSTGTFTSYGFFYGQVQTSNSTNSNLTITYSNGVIHEVADNSNDGSYRDPDESFCIPVGPGDSYVVTGGTLSAYFRPLN